MAISKFACSNGVWKFNNSLLKSQDYLNPINKVIEEEKYKYAVPMYDLDYLKNNSTNIEMIIDQDLFLEMLLLRIRGETIKFGSMKKKKTISA